MSMQPWWKGHDFPKDKEGESLKLEPMGKGHVSAIKNPDVSWEFIARKLWVAGLSVLAHMSTPPTDSPYSRGQGNHYPLLHSCSSSCTWFCSSFPHAKSWRNHLLSPTIFPMKEPFTIWVCCCSPHELWFCCRFIHIVLTVGSSKNLVVVGLIHVFGLPWGKLCFGLLLSFFGHASVDVIVTLECIHLYFLSIITWCLFRDVFESCHAPMFRSGSVYNEKVMSSHCG